MGLVYFQDCEQGREISDAGETFIYSGVWTYI